MKTTSSTCAAGRENSQSNNNPSNSSKADFEQRGILPAAANDAPQQKNNFSQIDIYAAESSAGLHIHTQKSQATPAKFFDILNGDSSPISCLYGDPAFELSNRLNVKKNTDTMILNVVERQKTLSWALSLLAQSESAKIMIEEALEQGWHLGLDDLNGPDFQIDVPQSRIVLDNQGFDDTALRGSLFMRNEMLIRLIRALRDVWQENRYGAFDEEYPPESILTLERVRAADLDVLVILVAWELREEEEGDLWRHILAGDNSDMAMRFMGYLERFPFNDVTNDALAAAFAQWFMSEKRIATCDHETLCDLDLLVADPSIVNPFGDERLAAIDVERLSCLPDRTAYLQGSGRDILADPLYAGMNDDINQIHLMHILHDLSVTYAGNVPFQNADLAERIFPAEMVEH